MGLTLGVDFGTATTCVAVMDERSLQPQVVPIRLEHPLVESLVWFDLENGRPPLLKSTSIHRRHPLSICQDASTDFSRYWTKRVTAFRDFLTRADWLSAKRESAMLLSYFKPELADPEVVDEYEEAVYDDTYATNLYTGEDLLVRGGYLGVVRSQVARPAPATPDYVAGTAALIRSAVQAAADRYKQRVSTLVVGIPSFEIATSSEARRAETTRREALSLGRIKEDFGARDFQVLFCGEALAAAWGIDVAEGNQQPVMLVIDVGAGTTDLSLIELHRARNGKWQPAVELLHHSLRWAGRDLNAAIAHALIEHPSMRHVREAMDPRAWQRLLDYEIEHIKRTLGTESQWFRIPLHELASHPDGDSEARQRSERLYRVVQPPLSFEGVDRSVRLLFGGWVARLEKFLEQAGSLLGRGGVSRVVGIELVGGALRFAPLRSLANDAFARSPLRQAPVNYRDAGGTEAQTVVARGLALRALLENG